MQGVSLEVVRLRWKVCNTAAVAQRIRASVYGTEGRGFESLQPHEPHLQLGPRKWRLLVTPNMLGHSGRCTYRNTYRLRSINCCSQFSLVRLPPDFVAHTIESPRTLLDVVTHSPVKFTYPSGRDSAQGAPAMTYEVGDSSTMATTNPPTIGLTKLLYSVSETAHLLSLSRSTVYAFMKSGELLAVYPTSKARIPAGAIRQFVQNSEDLARAERQSQRLRIR